MGSRTGFSDGREELEPLLPPKGVIREYVEIILTCLLFILFLRAYVLQQSDSPSGSMEDTILVGDYIIVNRFLYAPTLWEWERLLLPVREIRRSDVVVFKHPPDPARDFIKRVVGVPGDTVELRRGFLFVNGAPVEEPYDVSAPLLPGNLLEAIEAFERGSLFRDALGDEFVQFYAHLKRAEWDRYVSTISDWEQREYFSLF